MAISKTKVTPDKRIQSGQNGQEEGGEKEMSFLEHLEELRWHIIKSLIAIISVGIVLFIFQKWLFDYIIFGPTHKDFISYKVMCNISHYLGLGDSGCLTPPEFKIIGVGFAEPFITSFTVSFVAGFIVAFPYVFGQIWAFIKPGLLPKERSAARGVIFVCTFLFFTGVLFGYFVVAPFAVNFLGGYTIPGVENSPTLKSFIVYMVMFTLPTGMVFELPIVVYFLTRVGLVTPEDMKKYRRHAIIIILFVAAVVTPPDVLTQFLVGVPLYVLYELSIGVSWWVLRKDEDYLETQKERKAEEEKKKAAAKQKSNKKTSLPPPAGAEPRKSTSSPQKRDAARQLRERSLRDKSFVILIMNEKQIGHLKPLFITGITETGYQVALDVIKDSNQIDVNELKEHLEKMLDRGFSFKNGLLCLIDDNESQKVAVREVFGNDAYIQIDPDQAIDKIISHISTGDQNRFQHQLMAALSENEYMACKKALDQIYQELTITDPASAELITEKLSQLLAVKQLGVALDVDHNMTGINEMAKKLQSEVDQMNKTDHPDLTPTQMEELFVEHFTQSETQNEEIAGIEIMQRLISSMISERGKE